MSNVVDLDVLKPEPRLVRIATHEVDVSFIPCAITFEVDDILRKMAGLSSSDLTTNLDRAREAFDLGVDLCVLYCERKYPEMTREWFMDNTNPVQLEQFVDAIKDALMASYKGVGGEGKNVETAKRKRNR